MVLPFKKSEAIHRRYDMLSPQPMAKTHIEYNNNKSDSNGTPFDGQQYATFLKTLSSNNGNPNTNWKTQERLARPRNKSAGVRSSYSQTDISTRALGKHRKNAQSAPNLNSLQGVSEFKKLNEEGHKKQIKVIEDYMLLCKQEQRDLKRVEGDIVKKETNLRKTMKNYENDVYENKLQQENEATLAGVDENRLKQQFFIEDEKITKDRTQRNMGILQKGKEGDNKGINKMNGLGFRFENITDAIQLKRNEMDAMVKEFEAQLKQKEEEEFRLKKEFANLAIEINMEAQKHRVQGENDKEVTSKVLMRDKMDNVRRLNALDDKVKARKDKSNQAERSKRRYSQELQNITGSMSLQVREDGRRLKDIRVKLDKNSVTMKESQIKSDLLEMERMGKQSEEKVLAVNARRKEIQDMMSQQRKQKNDQTTDEFRMRNFLVNHEMKKHDLKDNINHLQKVVDRHEDTEHVLYGQVRQLESERRKQEQNVVSLRQQLHETQKHNKILLNETALRCQHKEQDLETRLQREEAHLNKALTEREEKIQSLAKYRGNSKEEKHMLDEQMKNKERLQRIERKSNVAMQQKELKKYQTVY